MNKCDINAKKETKIDTEKLAKKLGCPVIETISTGVRKNGLDEVVNMAMLLKGKGQKAPYSQNGIDLQSKEAVQEADKARYEFVNEIVKEVENRKVYTKDRNSQDKIDNVLTNKWIGIPFFALIMFLVFDISQSTVAPYIAA